MGDQDYHEAVPVAAQIMPFALLSIQPKELRYTLPTYLVFTGYEIIQFILSERFQWLWEVLVATATNAEPSYLLEEPYSALYREVKSWWPNLISGWMQ